MLLFLYYCNFVNTFTAVPCSKMYKADAHVHSIVHYPPSAPLSPEWHCFILQKFSTNHARGYFYLFPLAFANVTKHYAGIPSNRLSVSIVSGFLIPCRSPYRIVFKVWFLPSLVSETRPLSCAELYSKSIAPSRVT